MQKEFLTKNFEPIHLEKERLQLTVEGVIPPGMQGLYLRNGPNPLFPCDPYSLFDGDGMLHAVNIEGQNCYYSNKWIKTKGYSEEFNAKKSLYPSVLNSKPIKNTSNTSVLFYRNKLLTLWEWGAPYIINPLNLETEGEFRFENTLLDSFTAHPRQDFKNNIYYFFSHTIENSVSKLKIGTIANDLKLNYLHTHYLDRANSSVHDIAFTKRFLLFFDLPLLTDGNNINWYPDQKGQILLFDKNFNQQVVKFEINPCWVFHIINAFEIDNFVFVYACRWPRYPNAQDTPHIYEWKLNLTTLQVDERVVAQHGAELPTINKNFNGEVNNFCYSTGSSYSPDAHVSEFSKTNLKTGECFQYNYGSDWACGEPYFSANAKSLNTSKSEDEGWVFNLVSSYKLQKSFLAIHDASQNIMPIVAKVHIPHFIPMGFHGTWVDLKIK